MASCHVGHTSTSLITKVKQRLAQVVHKEMTTQITSISGAVRMCTRILWTGKASSSRHREEGDITPVCVKYIAECLKKKHASLNLMFGRFKL
jgi:hypothetical protein